MSLKNYAIVGCLLVCSYLFYSSTPSKHLPTSAICQDSIEIEYFNPTLGLQYKDATYKNSIKTVRLHIKDAGLADPILLLNSRTQLELVFDDLQEDAAYYSYTLLHCTADWQPSDLDPFDYIDGFSQDDITRYDYSIDTKQPFVQYYLTIPNNNMRITKSGNYILKVFDSDDDEKIILTRRFMVFEQGLSIAATLLSPNLNRLVNTHQKLNFSINYGGLNISNPLEELKVFVLQNGRWDNALANLQPVFIRGKELVYNYVDKNLFEAGNEFRFVDFRSFRQFGNRIADVKQLDTVNHVYVQTDKRRIREERMFRVYYTDKNGKYRIGIHDGIFTDLGADYAKVHFSLDMPEPLIDGNIYVWGGLTDWYTNTSNQMTYNYKKKVYETTLYLRQGHYDYQYVIAKDGKKALENATIEGNYYSTENDYTILVYYRSFNARYDRLIAVQRLNSRKFLGR